MIRIVLFWQKVHFYIYKFNVYTQLNIFGLPFILLLKNKYIIELYKKRGVENPSKIVTSVLIDPKTSTVSLLTEGIMLLLVGIIIFSLLNILSAGLGYIIGKDWSIITFMSILVIPSIAFNYVTLWRNDKYLIYFKEFEKQSKTEKHKWTWISLITVFGIVLLLIISFVVMKGNVDVSSIPR